MLKKVGCVLLAAFVAAGLWLPAAAADPYVSGSVAPPVILESAERDTGSDRAITLSYSAPTSLEPSDRQWVVKETVVFCEASADGKNWYTVKTLPETEGVFELLLMEEIMPALAKGGVEMYQKIYGFDYSLHLATLSDCYSADGGQRMLAVSAPSGAVSFHCPEFTFIDCAVPDDAELTLDFPAFMYYPNETELTLPYPTRPGYAFAGWLKWNGGYTETVPAGSRYFRVTAQWDPRTYAVNYVLSTVADPRFSYSFGRANNSANPTKHTVGESETLYDLKSPVGGYAFDGWYLTADFSGERLKYLPADMIGDLILYARWITFEERDARRQKENEAYARSLHYGDLDFDDKITSADARLALRASVGLETLSAKALRRADIFDSGILTPANARSILRVAVGLDSLYDILYESGIIRPGELTTG